MKIGLYFGTFNPIHVGHLIIANHMVEYSDLDEIWMVVTPHNPFKKKSSLLENHHRFELVYRAIQKLSPQILSLNYHNPTILFIHWLIFQINLLTKSFV